VNATFALDPRCDDDEDRYRNHDHHHNHDHRRDLYRNRGAYYDYFFYLRTLRLGERMYPAQFGFLLSNNLFDGIGALPVQPEKFVCWGAPLDLGCRSREKFP